MLAAAGETVPLGREAFPGERGNFCMMKRITVGKSGAGKHPKAGSHRFEIPRV